jgi:hypothetical protein
MINSERTSYMVVPVESAGQHYRNRYDVYVAPSGAVYAYGPGIMQVQGTPTPCDHVAFVRHVRARVDGKPFPLVRSEDKRQVKVCGVRVLPPAPVSSVWELGK